MVKENVLLFPGIFSNEHLSYEHERNKGPEGMPSLAEMVRAAIKVLQKNENGYFLMVSILREAIILQIKNFVRK